MNRVVIWSRINLDVFAKQDTKEINVKMEVSKKSIILKNADKVQLYWMNSLHFHSLQRSKENFKIFAKASKESKENFINKNHILILYFIAVNKNCNTYLIKFVIFKEIIFSETHVINEMFGKSNFHERKCPKNCDFQGKISQK